MVAIELILRVIDCALHLVSLNCKQDSYDQFAKLFGHLNLAYNLPWISLLHFGNTQICSIKSGC